MRIQPSLFCIGIFLLIAGLPGTAAGQNIDIQSTADQTSQPSAAASSAWTPVTTPIATPAEKVEAGVSRAQRANDAPAGIPPPVMLEETVKNSEPGFGSAVDTTNNKPVFLHWALVTFEPQPGGERPAAMALRAAGSADSVAAFVKNLSEHAITSITGQSMQDVYPSAVTPFGAMEVVHKLPATTQGDKGAMDKAAADKVALAKSSLGKTIVSKGDTAKKSGLSQSGEAQDALKSYLNSFRRDHQTPESLASDQFVRAQGHLTLMRPEDNANLGPSILANIDWSLTRSDTTPYAGVWALPQTTTQSIQAHAILPVNRVSVVAVVVVTQDSSFVGGFFEKTSAVTEKSPIRYMALVLLPLEKVTEGGDQAVITTTTTASPAKNAPAKVKTVEPSTVKKEDSHL